MKGDLFDGLIQKFLNGDATPHEKSMLAAWLKEDPAHEEIFYCHLSRQESNNPQYLPDINSRVAAYEAFLKGERLMPALNPAAARPRPHMRSRAMPYLRVAASLVLLFCATLYFFRDTFFYCTYRAEDGRISFVTLPDGSTVTLNANSSIKVFRDFMAHDSRQVWIRGEAFFEVTKKPNGMKFIVHTDNFDVEVLGTKFNVNNRRGKTEVMLAEGKVKLVAKDRKPLIMKPGEQVSLSEAEDHYKKRVVEPQKFQAWRNNKLTFEDTPLSEVAEMIEDYYGVHISIADPSLATRQFTGTLPNNDLEVILIALGTAYKIDVVQTKTNIILEPGNLN